MAEGTYLPAGDGIDSVAKDPTTLDQNENGLYIVLGSLPAAALVTEDGLARLLGKECRESIKRAVERNELPRPVRLMGKNTWTIGTIVRHVEARLEAEARRFTKNRA